MPVIAASEPGYARELHTWGLIGAAAWLCPLFLLACSVWALALPPSLSGGLSFTSAACTSAGCAACYLFFLLLQLGLLLVHQAVLSHQEPAPVQIPRLGLYGGSWPCVFLARVVLRTRKLRDVAATGTMLCATSASAALFVYVYPRMRALHAFSPPSLAFSCVFGLCLGLVHTLLHLLRCRDVLAFPFIYRHRYFRLRQCLPEVLVSALRVTALALALALLLKPAAAAGTPTPTPTSSSGSSSSGGSAMWFGLALSRHCAALLAAFHAGSLWVFGWLAGHALLAIVLTEPPRLVQQHEGQQGAAATLLQALGSSSPIVQDLALMEFAELAEGNTAQHIARRADVFADETGRLGWTPLAGFLVDELREFSGTLGAALSAMAGEGAGAKASGGRPPRAQWNVLSAPSGLVGAKIGKEQDKAAWSVRAKFYRLRFCLRALSGMASASRAEDRFGVVLLCDPLLADVLACLLATVLALQQYTKQESSFSSRTHGGLARHLQGLCGVLCPSPHPVLQEPELCAHALEDAARNAAYHIVNTFGASLEPLLKECHAALPLPQVSMAEVARLLQGMLQCKE